MLLDQVTDAVDLFPAEAVAALQQDEVEPELRFAVVTFHMDVRRLAPIAGVEEEPEWAHAEHGRHADMLRRPGAMSNGAPHADREPHWFREAGFLLASASTRTTVLSKMLAG